MTTGALQRPAAQPPPFIGRPGDAWWLWAPMPILAAAAWLLAGGDRAELALKGLLTLNFMHLGATWTRLYGAERGQHPLLAWGLPPLLLAAAGLLVLRGHTQAMFLAVFAANMLHIGLQNYGIIRIAARRCERADELLRRLDRAYQIAVPAWLALWFATARGEALFGAELSRLPGALLWGCGAAAGLAAAATWVTLLQRWRAGRPIAAERVALHLAYGPGAWLCFWLLPPQLAPLPVAGLHYIQYLVIVRRFHQRRGALSGAPGLWARAHPLLYLLLLAALAPGIPALVNAAAARIVEDSVIAIGAAASVHHFLADGIIWKLRDRRVARVVN